jgi:Tol biopolymer transport system component
MQLSPDGAFWTALATATTDNDGRATARVRMGIAAGTGRVLVAAPTLGLLDTASFTIEPGVARSLVMAPKDTVVSVGGVLTLRGALRDRFGNARLDAVSYSVSSTRATVAGSVLSGATFGRVRVTARVGSMQDFGDVSIVPRGTIAAYTAMENSGQRLTLYTFDVDGGNLRAVVPTERSAGFYGSMPASWSPDGKTLVFHDFKGDLTTAIYTVDVRTGAARRLVPLADQLAQESFPVTTRDGAWVYYDGAATADAARAGEATLYRIRPDGSGRELVGPSGAYQDAPSPSPDGAKIVSVGSAAGVGQAALGNLQVLTVATRQLTSLGVQGNPPAWSPVGDQIAFVNPNGSVYVVGADGSGLRAVTSTQQYLSRLAWSPDGKYLIVSRGRARVYVIDVATGEEVPVPITIGDYGFVVTAWTP